MSTKDIKHKNSIFRQNSEGDLRNFFLAEGSIQEESGEDECHTEPLPRDERVAEEDDRGQHREELARGRDNGAGQWTKLTENSRFIICCILVRMAIFFPHINCRAFTIKNLLL